MMSFFMSENVIDFPIFFAVIIVVVLLSVTALVISIKFRLKRLRGDFEEQIGSLDSREKTSRETPL